MNWQNYWSNTLSYWIKTLPKFDYLARCFSSLVSNSYSRRWKSFSIRRFQISKNTFPCFRPPPFLLESGVKFNVPSSKMTRINGPFRKGSQVGKKPTFAAFAGAGRKCFSVYLAERYFPFSKDGQPNPSNKFVILLIKLDQIWLPWEIFVGCQHIYLIQLDLERCLYCWFVTEKENNLQTNLAAWVSVRQQAITKTYMPRFLENIWEPHFGTSCMAPTLGKHISNMLVSPRCLEPAPFYPWLVWGSKPYGHHTG